MKTIITMLLTCFTLTGCMTNQKVTMEQKIALCQEHGMVYQIMIMDETEDVICYSEVDGYFVYFELIPEKEIRKTGY